MAVSGQRPAERCERGSDAVVVRTFGREADGGRPVMVALRALATVGAGLLIVAIGIAGSKAQEAQKDSPEQVLKSHDLKRSGTTWLLPGETAILKDLRDARALSREIGDGIAQQQAF